MRPDARPIQIAVWNLHYTPWEDVALPRGKMGASSAPNGRSNRASFMFTRHGRLRSGVGCRASLAGRGRGGGRTDQSVYQRSPHRPAADVRGVTGPWAGALARRGRRVVGCFRKTLRCAGWAHRLPQGEALPSTAGYETRRAHEHQHRTAGARATPHRVDTIGWWMPGKRSAPSRCLARCGGHVRTVTRTPRPNGAMLPQGDCVPHSTRERCRTPRALPSSLGWGGAFCHARRPPGEDGNER
jgi:hypothetical protein